MAAKNADTTEVAEQVREAPAETGSFVDKHVRSHQYRAVADCDYFGQVAYPAGSLVNGEHPEVPRWLEDGLIEKAAG